MEHLKVEKRRETCEESRRDDGKTGAVREEVGEKGVLGGLVRRCGGSIVNHLSLAAAFSVLWNLITKRLSVSASSVGFCLRVLRCSHHFCTCVWRRRTMKLSSALKTLLLAVFCPLNFFQLLNLLSLEFWDLLIPELFGLDSHGYRW